MPHSTAWENYDASRELAAGDPPNSRCAVLGSPLYSASTDFHTYESQVAMLYNEKPHIEFVKKSGMMTTIKKYLPSKRMLRPMWKKIKPLKFRLQKKKPKKRQVLDADEFNDETAVVPARHVSTPLAIPLFSKSCLRSRMSQDFNHLMAASKTSLSSKKSSIKSVFDTSSNIHTNATTPN
ncbi:hypothetical protein Cantr_02724 [Candida viswanathii]|uniref:Uncharacterized protein n=1 Tax=Candida viswanathii TaxID=5486 RepID=A0A367YLL2_9ASCO|nr:hypothetical protein Cantr_02724 [Candida viswanathii]